MAHRLRPHSRPGHGAGHRRVIGIDRGVTITAALSDGRILNCPQLTTRERAQIRKHQRRGARAPKNSSQKTTEYAKVAELKAREADRRKDWCEKTSTMLARSYDLVRFEKLNIKNMTRSAKRTIEEPGRRVAQKAGLNRAILAQEPSRVRLLLLRLHLQRGHPMQQPASRQDRTAKAAPGAKPVPEGQHRPDSGRVSVNRNPPGLKSPSFKRGRMSMTGAPD